MDGQTVTVYIGIYSLTTCWSISKLKPEEFFSSELYLWTLGQLRRSRPNTAGLNVRPSV